MTRRTRLYTEMVTARAVIHGDANRLLAHHAIEPPVALQLGGSVPAELAQAVRIAGDFGYDEVNLNVGCPSDRVQSGCFGAALMARPELVAECAAAMIAASQGPEITVKCRIGIDDQIPKEVLPAFLETVARTGVKSFAIHARKAWLQGLSPKQNREVPPLDHALVLAMKHAFPTLEIVLNGGVCSLDQAVEFLAQGLDGVMIGRAAYHHPADMLLDADRRIFGEPRRLSAHEVVRAMLPYIEAERASGTRLATITRHMLGLFTGAPGARQWRRILSEGAHLPGAGPELVEQALAAVSVCADLTEMPAS